MRMKVVVCDDEAIYREAVCSKIHRWAEAQGHRDEIQISEFQSCEDMLETMEAGGECHLLFLDIEIPGEMNGVEAARVIRRKNPYIPIVFITNYAYYALDGYEVNALRYLMKPVTQESIDKCLSIAWDRVEMTIDRTVIVRDGAMIIVLPFSDFILAESYGHNLIIKASGGQQYSERERLVKFIERARNKLVIQCHRSYAVNLIHVRKLKPGWVTMANGDIVPTGAKFEEQFYDQFMSYHQGKGMLRS